MKLPQTVEIHDPVTGEATPIDIKAAWPAKGVITLPLLGGYSRNLIVDNLRN